MFGVDAKVSPGVLPGLQGDWPLLLWDNVPGLVVNLVGLSSHGTPSEGCEEFRWAFLVGARWYISEYRIYVQFWKGKMVKRCCRTEQHRFSDVSLGPWRLTPHNLIPPPWSSTTYHQVECKQNPMNSWGDVLRKTPTGAHACLELIEGNRMQWLQRSHAWPCCRCWGHFVSQGNNRTQIKTQTSSWGRNYHKWSKNVQDFHHRCQWNSKNARHIRTHFQVFQQMISPWPVPMLQHVASFPKNQICKSKQSTLPPIIMVQWRMGPYKRILSSTISVHFPLSPWFMGGNCNKDQHEKYP